MVFFKVYRPITAFLLIAIVHFPDNCVAAFVTAVGKRVSLDICGDLLRPASLKGYRGNVEATKSYRKKMQQLHRTALESGFDLNRVQRVFYPFSGTDAALPLILFPNARKILLLDDHSFASLEQLQKGRIPVQGPIGGAYRFWEDLDLEGAMGPRILGDLLSLNRGAEILRVDLFNETTNLEFPHISALVEFDLSDGVGKRILYFRSGALPTEYSSTQVTLKDLKNFKADALIVKAAEGKLKHPYFRKVHSALEEGLRSALGFIVEGIYQGSNSDSCKPDFEFSEAEDKDLRRVLIPNVPFGYKEAAGAVITEFQRAKSP